MSDLSFAKSILNATSQSDGYALLHGTSLQDFCFSVHEGGFPSLSVALTDCRSDYNKFGNIVLTFDAPVLKKSKTTIYTRDAYTADSPSREITGFDLKKAVSKEEEIAKYNDISGNVFADLRSMLETKHFIEYEGAFRRIARNSAHRLAYLERQGINVEIPYKPTIELDDFSLFIEDQLVRNGYTNFSDIPFGKVFAEELVGIHDQYAHTLQESDKGLVQRRGGRLLKKEDSEKLDSVMSKIKRIAHCRENPTLKVDSVELKSRISQALEKVNELEYYQVVFDSLDDLISNERYCCNDKFFSNQGEAWQYMAENSGANSQQNMSYSENEIFSLIGRELSAAEVTESLRLIDSTKEDDLEVAKESVRQCQREIVSLLGLSDMRGWAEARDLQKKLYPMILSGKADVEKVVRLRGWSSDDLSDGRAKRLDELIHALKKGMDLVPDVTSYFEVTLGEGVSIDSSLLKSVHVPIENQKDFEEFFANKKDLMNKVSFYDPKELGGLRRSLKDSSSILHEADFDTLKPQRRVDSKLTL